MLPSAGSCASCQQPASSKCSRCQSVFYCNKEHQLEDWRKHKSVCHPYAVKSSLKFGRHLVASRDIKKGDIVFSEEPLAIGPRHIGPLPDSCPGCYRGWYPGTNSTTCPGCQWPVCNKSCSGLTNPDRHGAECHLFKIVKKAIKSCPMEIVIPLRCLLLQTLKPAKWKILKELAIEASAKHVNSTRDKRVAVLESNLVTRISRHVSHLIPDCSAQTVKNVFDLLEVSGREFFTPFSGPMDGVYPSYCRIVHSCLPNFRVTFDLPSDSGDPGKDSWKSRITAQAIKDIAKGEPLTFGVVNTLSPTLIRQRQLFETRNFRCSCARCLDPHELGLNTATLKCVRCPGYVVPTDPTKIEKSKWACDLGCGHTSSSKEVASVEQAMMYRVKMTRYGLPGQEPSTEKLEELVKELELVLHPNHQLCFIVKNLLARFYGNEDDGGLDGISDDKLQKKSVLCQQSRKFLESPYLPHGSTSIAEILIEQHRADFEIAKRSFSSKLWDEDRTIQALGECRTLLRGVSEVLSGECYSTERTKLKDTAVSHDFVLMTWANSKGLKLPDN